MRKKMFLRLFGEFWSNALHYLPRKNSFINTIAFFFNLLKNEVKIVFYFWFPVGFIFYTELRSGELCLSTGPGSGWVHHGTFLPNTTGKGAERKQFHWNAPNRSGPSQGKVSRWEQRHNSTRWRYLHTAAFTGERGKGRLSCSRHQFTARLLSGDIHVLPLVKKPYRELNAPPWNTRAQVSPPCVGNTV